MGRSDGGTLEPVKGFQARDPKDKEPATEVSWLISDGKP